MQDILPAYAELCCLSNFSFLQGASHPEELVARAHALGYSALAITDDCSMAGVVRAHVAAKAHGLKLLIGSRFEVDDGEHGRFALVLLATTREAYGHLCGFITRLRRRSPKGTYHLARHEIDATALPGCLAIALPARHAPQSACDAMARWLLQHFIGRCWLGVVQRRAFDDELHLHRLRESAGLCAVPLVAVGDVRMHQRSRKPLHDVLTATRIGRALTECGFALAESAEQRLRSRLLLSQRFAPGLLAETLNVGRAATSRSTSCATSTPPKSCPPVTRPRAGCASRCSKAWPGAGPTGFPPSEHELALIAELRYEHYFLTVHDIVAFARSRHILCQGRGSAANSVVCYCLGITEVNPDEMTMLFERFISRERREPPDIDVDFEHQRREEVVQYLYAKYGRDRAALTATVICYRPRSALRDVGKALGFAPDALHALARGVRWWNGGAIERERLVEAGLDPDALAVRQLAELTAELMGFPRHLSQHTGGFVLTSGPLSSLVPIQNAAMADRTVIEWDKDDLDALGLLKVDVLALGMLTAIRKALDLVGRRLGRPFGMQDIPGGDAATYDMICAADTVGVFQIESRAQMSMLPPHLLRPGDRGRAGAAGADPGWRRAPLPEPPSGQGADRLPEEPGEGAGPYAGCTGVPGAVHADRHDRGRLHAR